MEYKEWKELQTKMAIEVIARDLCDIMVPYREGIERAKQALAERNQQALDVEWRMGQALIALETLGYGVRPNGEVRGASRLAGEASSAVGATSTDGLEGNGT